MSRVPLRTQTGMVVGEATLEPALFEAQVNVPVMHQVVVAQMNARRSGTHATKTRGDVRGGGKKPYKQKGTGRARQGSIRAPHYVGGGVVFGPHPRDYTQKVPRKMRAAALRSALSDRAREGKVAVVDSLSFEAPKTREAVEALRSMDIEGSVLLALDQPDEMVWKSFRNLPRVHVITVDQLNTYDILARDWLVLTKAALEKLGARAQENTSVRRGRGVAKPASGVAAGSAKRSGDPLGTLPSGGRLAEVSPEHSAAPSAPAEASPGLEGGDASQPEGGEAS